MYSLIIYLAEIPSAKSVGKYTTVFKYDKPILKKNKINCSYPICLDLYSLFSHFLFVRKNRVSTFAQT